jgi:hypothetical protein
MKNIKVSFGVNNLALNVMMRLKINHVNSPPWMMPIIFVARKRPNMYLSGIAINSRIKKE